MHIESQADISILAFRKLFEASLGTSSKDTQQIAILIDPAIHDPLSEHDESSRCKKLTLRVPRINRSRQPYLLTLKNQFECERIISASIHIAAQECAGLYDCAPGRPRSICAWLLPNQHPNWSWGAINNALNQRAILSAPGANNLALRYWDPRISNNLPKIIGDAGWTDFLKEVGLRDWIAADDAGKPVSISGPLDDFDPLHQPQPSGWKVDSGQLTDLQILSWVNRLVHAARSWDIEKKATRQEIDEIVRRAIGYGCRDEADISRFTHAALTIHPFFDRNPVVKSILCAIKSGEIADGEFAKEAQQWSDSFITQLQSTPYLPE